MGVLSRMALYGYTLSGPSRETAAATSESDDSEDSEAGVQLKSQPARGRPHAAATAAAAGGGGGAAGRVPARKRKAEAVVGASSSAAPQASTSVKLSETEIALFASSAMQAKQACSSSCCNTRRDSSNRKTNRVRAHAGAAVTRRRGDHR